MSVTVRSPRMAELVDPAAELETLGTGFTFTEGPIWNRDGGYLLFSDMPGDVRRRWDPDQGVTEVMRPSNKGNGMAYDAAGNVVVCEHSTSRVVRELADGTREVVASHYDGRELNSPNDVVVARDGALYFTDPPFGRTALFGVERERELPFCGLYRVAPGGEPRLAAAEDEFDMPNGLCFSPDGARLYVNDSPRAHVKVFEVDAYGGLGGGRLFADSIGRGIGEEGVPDGMKCDREGNVWVTGPGGLWVFGPDGVHLGVVEVPEVVANFTWGGPELRDLFLCASSTLRRIRTTVAGNPLP